MNANSAPTMNRGEKFLFGIGMSLLVFLIIASYLIHLWTVLIAYDFGGFGPALITFLLPFFAQVFWATYHIMYLRTILDPYLLGIIFYLLFLLLMMLCLILSSARSSCEISKR